MIICSTHAALARRPACSFSPLGIWIILACRSSIFFLTYSRYFFIISPLHSESPFTWFVTTWESQWITTLMAPTAIARSSPLTSASYSASLLVIGKLRRTVHLISSLSREWSTIPAPLAYLLDDPFMWILQWGCSFAPLALHVSEFRNEVSDHLPLNGSKWAVLYVEFT